MKFALLWSDKTLRLSSFALVVGIINTGLWPTARETWNWDVLCTINPTEAYINLVNSLTQCSQI